MALRGNLRDFSLTQLLNLVGQAKKTGALTLTRGKSQATLYLSQGMLVHLSLDGQAPNLRRLLERAGRIDEAQDRLLPREARGDKEWGVLLINTGLVKRADILEVVHRHTLEMVCRLFTWTEGRFHFEPNVLPPDDRITLPLDLQDVILEVNRRVRERKSLEEELPDLGVALSLTHDEYGLKRMPLSPDERRVVSSIDPSRTMREIAQAHSLTDFQIRKIVYRLLSTGLVELAKPEISAPARKGIIPRLVDRVKRLYSPLRLA